MSSKWIFPLSNFKLIMLLLATALATGGSTSFNIKSYEAHGDGKTDCTKALASAFTEACAEEGKSTILIPQGNFLIGQTDMKGPCNGSVELQVQGVVEAPPLSKFSTDTWFNFGYLDGFSITGGGTFDGKGAEAWPHNQCPKNFQCKLLPTSLRFSFMKNVNVQDITSLNSKFFHIIIFQSSNLHLSGLTITADGDSPNTDGIHIGDSTGITIKNAKIGTGDDCVSMGPGCKDISVSKVVCGPGHGISVGSLGKYPKEGDVEGVHVTDSTFDGSTNGIRIKSWRNSPSASSAFNMTFENLVMNNVFNPINIDQEYCPYASCTKGSPSQVKLSDITFKNIRGTSASKVAVKLVCSAGIPCQGIHLSDINLEYKGNEGGPATANCTNIMKGITSGKLNPPACF